MKLKVASFVAIFEITSVIFPIGILTPYAFADSPNPHPTSSSCDLGCTCNSGCEASKKILDAIDAGTSCCGSVKGKDDKYLASNPIKCEEVMYDGTEGHKFTDCRISQVAKLGPLPHHCDAKALDELARDYDQGMAIAWTVVSATCIAACAATAADWFFIAAATCAGLDVAATVADMGLAIKLTTDAKERVLDLKADQASNYGSLISGVGLFGSLGASVAVGATSASANATGAAVSCVNAAFSTVVMSLKWDAFVKNRANAEAECGSINQLGWPSDVRPTTRPESGPSQGGNSSNSPKFGGGTTGLKNAEGGGNSMLNDMANNFPGSNFGAAAATSGPLGKILDSFPNKKDFPAVLDKMGMNLGTLKEKLSNGSPASALGSMMNLSSEAQAYLDNVQKLASNGQLEVSGDAATMQGGGGKGGSNGGSSGDGGFNPMSLFAPKEAPVLNANSLDFGAKSPPSAISDGNDIWHSSVKGSIFEIVSQKLKKTGPRIDQLEWASPLNRALNGLPKK